MTIHNQAGKDKHDNVVDAPLLSFPGKGLKGVLCNRKEKQLSKKASSMAGLSSEFITL